MNSNLNQFSFEDEKSDFSERYGVYKTYQTKIGVYKTNTEWEFISNILPLNSIKILDIGGGDGRFAKRLALLNHDVTNIDINQEAINVSLSKGISKSYCVEYKCFNENNFDFAIAIEILMNEKPTDLLLKANQFLLINGIFIFVAPNKNSWRYYLREFRRNKNIQEDLTYSTYIQLLSTYGFELLDANGFMWMPLKVASNSNLVYVFEFIEKLLHLSRWKKQSPWIIYACKKIRDI